MMRCRYLLLAVLVTACSSTTPGSGDSSVTSDPDSGTTGDVVDASEVEGECPCPTSLACEQGHCVRPDPEDAGQETGTPMDASPDALSVDTSSDTDPKADTRDGGTADVEGDTCECSDATDPCCDGCHWQRGKPCRDNPEYRCAEPNSCQPDREKYSCTYLCTPEDNWRCTGAEKECEHVGSDDCEPNLYCNPSEDGYASCLPSCD